MLATKTSGKEHSSTTVKAEKSKPTVDKSTPQIQLSTNWHSLATFTGGKSAMDGTDESNPKIIQTKLSDGEANDPCEREADAVADKVMRTPLNTGEEPEPVQTKALERAPIQRQFTRSNDEDRVQTQSESKNNSPPITNNVQSAISSSTDSGPVPANVLSRVEPVIGADLSGVQVHNNASSHKAARDVNAKAFTHQNDIYLGEGENANNISLMAHELTHTVQQSGGNQASRIQRKPNPEEIPYRAEIVDKDDIADKLKYHGESSVRIFQKSDRKEPLSILKTGREFTVLGKDGDLLLIKLDKPGLQNLGGQRIGYILGICAKPIDLKKAAEDKAKIGAEQGEAIKDAAGNVLPGDITVNWVSDPFNISFSRVNERGSQKFKVLVTYAGQHAVDFSDKTRTLTHDIGSKLLAASATVDNKHQEITIDLYGDNSRVIKLKDKTEFRTLTGKPSRAHGFSLHYLGRMRYSSITMFVQDPGSKELAPTPEKEVPGKKPGFSIPAGSGELQALLDGDGDQYKELKMVVEKLDSYNSGDPKTIRIILRQRESGVGQQYDFTLTDGSGMIFPLVNQISDGRVPTKVALNISKSVSLTLNVPKVIENQVQYTLTVGSQAVNYHFPAASYKPKPVFTGAISPTLIGNILSYDLKVGAYQDPFRLTFKPKTLTAANLGFSPLSNNKPWGGQGITVSLPSTIALALSKKSFSALSLDIDNDGKEDVAIHDELTTPAEYDGGGPTESNRNHTFRFSGSAVSGEKTLHYRIRHGRFNGGRNQGNTTQTAAEDVDTLVEQRNQGSFNNQIDLYEQALMRTRKKAADAGLISQKTFEAWAGLSESMIQIRPQMAKGVNATLKKQAVARAGKFYDLFAHDTRFEDKPISASQGGSSYSNPYTGTMSTIAPFYSRESGPGLRLQTAIKADDWNKAFFNYRRLVSGFDSWVLNRFKKDRGEHHADTKEAALLSKRMRELTEIEKFQPKRIYGVFHPSESMSGESGYVPHIPLALYYWKKDDTWYLKDITNPDHTYIYDTAAASGELHPPKSLLTQMNDPDHFPIGMITYDIPGNRGGYINTTSPLTFKKFLSYLGLGLAAIGLTLTTFGTGTVAVAGAWTLAASAVATATSAGIDIADHINRGNLTSTVALLNLGTIVASLAGAAALGSGQIVSAAGKATGATKWSGNWAKLALMADRVYVPMVATTAAADVVTLAVFTVDAAKKLDAIENGAGDRASKDRAKLMLLSQLALMGGLTALSVKGSLPNLKARRTLMLHEGPDGVPVVSDSYTFFMSQPKVKAEFAKSAGMKELLEKNPEVVYRLMRDPDVRNVILSAPKIAESFAKHPKAIKFLDEVIEEVNRRGSAAILKASSKLPSPTKLSKGQKTVSSELDSMVTKDPTASRQAGFDDSKIEDTTYLGTYLDKLYRDAKSAQSDLNKLTDKVAAASGGKPGYRPEPKNRERSLQKITGYGGDASRLNDLAGSKIVYNNLEDLYKGLAKVKETMGGRLVAYSDRFIKPQASGYRDIQMSVKLDNGHIAEFRLHLSQVDAVADIEHAIYEVSRSFKPNAILAGRQMSDREKAIKQIITEKTQQLYKGAMDKVPGQSP